MEISPLLSPAELFKLMSILKDARNVVITAHRGPDGDAMGSTLAWADYLMQLGKRVTVVLPTPCPDFLRWLPGAKNVLYYSKDDMRAAATQAVQNADLICLLDFNALHRLQDFAPVVERSKLHVQSSLSQNLRRAARANWCSNSSISWGALRK